MRSPSTRRCACSCKSPAGTERKRNDSAGGSLHLIDTIKANFARKSSAQLQEIIQANNPECWSPEAALAASELLQDRLAGRASEPQLAEEEPAPPPYHYEPGEIALGVLGGLLTGYLVIPYYERIEAPDLPLPFGPRIAWLALDTKNTRAVARAIGLREAREATWAEGVKGAYQSSVFITPPLGDWTLAVSTALFPPDEVALFVKPLLERLSGQFRDAQYFCTQRDLQLHGWARARKGQLVRGYAWLGQKALTLWDAGKPTKEERDLGFRFAEGQPPTVEQSENEQATVLDEDGVMQLAYVWSIDPTTLDEQFSEPLPGLLGTAAWPQAR
jgi:hypothetical protein